MKSFFPITVFMVKEDEWGVKKDLFSFNNCNAMFFKILCNIAKVPIKAIYFISFIIDHIVLNVYIKVYTNSVSDYYLFLMQGLCQL